MPMAEAEKLLFSPVDPTPKQPADPAAIKRAADLLKSAKKPLILLGKGAAYAQCDAAIKALVEDTGIPFLPMSMAKGLLPDDHPQNAGPARSFALPGCDVCLIVGARLNWLLGNGTGATWGNELKKFIQMDIMAHEIDSNVAIAAPLICDIASGIDQLRAALKGMPKADPEWMGAIASRVNASKDKLAPTLKAETAPGMMNYRNSLGAVRDVLAKNTNVVVVNEGANALDNGRMIIDQYLPRKRIDSGTWGIMGMGMGGAIGAAISTGEPVVAIEGDSAFGFSGMEVETMCRYNLPITVIIMNNGGIYKGNEPNAGGYDDPSPTAFVPGARYDMMATAFGGVGAQATTPAELTAALEAAIKSRRPTVINAVLDPDSGVESGRISGLNIERKKKA